MRTLLKGLSGLLMLVWGAGFFGNMLLFGYVEWLLIREQFWKILMPWLQLEVIGTLLGTQLFWILLAMTVIGYAGSAGLSKLAGDDTGPE